jgi:hypothetical protein
MEDGHKGRVVNLPIQAGLRGRSVHYAVENRVERTAMIDNERQIPESNQVPDDTSIAAPPPASREADGSDAMPPPSITGKGPMDQSVPDVVTGSTPVTRHDD